MQEVGLISFMRKFLLYDELQYAELCTNCTCFTAEAVFRAVYMCRFVPLGTIGTRFYAALCATRCVGTTLDYFMGHNAEVSSASTSQQDVPDSAAKAGCRSKRPGSDVAGNKQKSILGFFAGFEPTAKAVESIALTGSGTSETPAGEQRAGNSAEPTHQACSGNPSPSSVKSSVRTWMQQYAC